MWQPLATLLVACSLPLLSVGARAAGLIDVYQAARQNESTFRAARLTGSVEIYEKQRNNRLDTREVGAEILFEHYASTFQGDQRALSDASRQRIGCAPVPFPLDEDMLVQAAERIKPNLRDELRRSSAIF